jgi:integrase
MNYICYTIFYTSFMVVHFGLRKEAVSKKTGKCPISIRVSSDDMVVRATLPNLRVHPDEWNSRDATVLPPKKLNPANNHVEYNIILGDIKHRLNELHKKSLLSNKAPAKQHVVDAIMNVGEKKAKSNQNKPGFIEIFDEFISHSRSFKASRTITGYVTTRNVFEHYSSVRKRKLYFDDIDLRFFDDFRNYCFIEKKMSDNYFAKIIAHLKTFMLWASEREFHQNSLYTKFKAPEHDIEVIFLSQEELSTLYYHEFKSEKLDRVRDVFCFACFTGLRYSDLANLTRSNIVDGQIKLNVKKTKQKDLLIPLNSYAKSILEKYKESKYQLLPVISIQKLNAYIKEACKEAGIDAPTKITRYSGGNVVDETLPKYELITIHTARKSFVSNSLMFDIPVAVIKEVTGHKTERAFQKYVKVTDAYKKEKLGAWENSLEKK